MIIITIDIYKNGQVVTTIFITHETYRNLIESANTRFNIDYKFPEGDINIGTITRHRSDKTLYKIADSYFRDPDLYTFKLEPQDVSRPSTPTITSLMLSEWEDISEADIDRLYKTPITTDIDTDYNTEVSLNKNNEYFDIIYFTTDTFVRLIQPGNHTIKHFYINMRFSDGQIYSFIVIRNKFNKALYKIHERLYFHDTDEYTFNLDKQTQPTSARTALVSMSSEWENIRDHNIVVLKGTFSQYNARGHSEGLSKGACTIIAMHSIPFIMERLNTYLISDITSGDIDAITREGLTKYNTWQIEKPHNAQNANIEEGLDVLKYSSTYRSSQYIETDLSYKPYEIINLNGSTETIYINNVINSDRDLKILITNCIEAYYSEILRNDKLTNYISAILIKSNMTIAIFIPLIKELNLPYYIFNSHSDTWFLRLNVSHLIKCNNIDIFVNTILKMIPTQPDDYLNQTELNLLFPL